ncbi:KilA-N domain-containing protein [Desulfovibrio sp.]|uniref:KilA-N domain-containing protein n=1 Tax=Desulfovibrio sp. TaxID=885 RepID=UPI00345BD43B
MQAKGLEIAVHTKGQADYISLTDIAKYKSEFPADVVKNWMRSRETIEFLGLWEQLNNPDFKLVEFDQFKMAAGRNAFVLNPQKWIATTQAIGIQSKSGRYGGTFAHVDIAMEFASWISPEFKLYIIKDYQRLKTDEGHRLALEWNAKRELSKVNYRIHTDAIKEYLLPQHLTPQQINITYASEADILNMALFGMTAKQWRTQHPDATGNMRDHADIYQLIVLVNLESMNAELIKQGLPQNERLAYLNNMAIEQMRSLINSAAVQRLNAAISGRPTLPEAQKD